jgi:hypothetical protein
MKSQRLNKEKQLWKTATVCGQLKEDKSDFNKVFFKIELYLTRILFSFWYREDIFHIFFNLLLSGIKRGGSEYFLILAIFIYCALTQNNPMVNVYILPPFSHSVLMNSNPGSKTPWFGTPHMFKCRRYPCEGNQKMSSQICLF